MRLSTCDLMCVERKWRKPNSAPPSFTLALQTPPVQGPTRKRKAKWPVTLSAPTLTSCRRACDAWLAMIFRQAQLGGFFTSGTNLLNLVDCHERRSSTAENIPIYFPQPFSACSTVRAPERLCRMLVYVPRVCRQATMGLVLALYPFFSACQTLMHFDT